MKLSVVREHVETLRKRTTYRKVIDAEKGNRAPFGTHIGSIVRWILRLRKELASLAAAVETSGVVCPVCEGSKNIGRRKPCPCCGGGEADILVYIEQGPTGFRCSLCHGCGEVFDLSDPLPCPRCSVPAGAWVECETCNGRGSVAADNPADHAMFDPDGTDYAVYARAGGRTPCPDCNGRGKIRTPVALGRVWDEEE